MTDSDYKQTDLENLKKNKHYKFNVSIGHYYLNALSWYITSLKGETNLI